MNQNIEEFTMSKGKYESAGIHSNVSKRTLNGIKAARHPLEKMMNIQAAWLKGKNPWITLENPNKNETNKRFIRVRTNDILGHPKERDKKTFIMQ